MTQKRQEKEEVRGESEGLTQFTAAQSAIASRFNSPPRRRVNAAPRQQEKRLVIQARPGALRFWKMLKSSLRKAVC
jgi:hypothetical protein